MVKWLRAALEDLERWTAQQSQASRANPRARLAREYAVACDAAAAERYRSEMLEVEGAESAYADAAARLAHLRDQLDVPGVGDGGAVRALAGEVAWVAAEREEALDSRGVGVAAEELHAEGRARALATIGAELRVLLANASAERVRGGDGAGACLPPPGAERPALDGWLRGTHRRHECHRRLMYTVSGLSPHHRGRASCVASTSAWWRRSSRLPVSRRRIVSSA